MNKIQGFLKKSFNNNKEMALLFIGTMILNSIISHYGQLKPGTPLFMLAISVIIIGGLLLYRKKDTAIKTKKDSKSSILNDLKNKALMIIGIFTLLFILGCTNVMPKIISNNATIIVYLENLITNTVVIFFHLAILSILYKAMDSIDDTYGKKSLKIIILALIYISISKMLNLDAWTTYFGCVGIIDIYLNYKQIIAILCLPFMIIICTYKYLLKKFAYIK